MKGPFVKIELLLALPVYINTDAVQSIESGDDDFILIKNRKLCLL